MLRDREERAAHVEIATRRSDDAPLTDRLRLLTGQATLHPAGDPHPGERVLLHTGSPLGAPPVDIGINTPLAGISRSLQRLEALLFKEELIVLDPAVSLLLDHGIHDVVEGICDQRGIRQLLLEIFPKLEPIVPGFNPCLNLLRIGLQTGLLKEIGAIPQAARADIPWHGDQPAVRGSSLGPLVLNHVVLDLTGIEGGLQQVG